MPFTEKYNFTPLHLCPDEGGGGGSGEEPKTPIEKPGGDDTVDSKAPKKD